MSITESGVFIPSHEEYVGDRVHLYRGNSLDILPTLKPHSVDSAVFSPPYWWVCDYDHPDQIGLEDRPFKYVQRMAVIFAMLNAVVKPGGAMMLNVKDTRNSESPLLRKGRSRKEATFSGQEGRRKLVKGFDERELLGIPAELIKAARHGGWDHISKITWHTVTTTDHSPGDRPREVCEEVHYFLKPKYVNNHLRANYWDGTYIPENFLRIKAASSKDHLCPMPEELAQRLLCATCPQGGTVIDPFMGEGTVGAEATTHGRNFVGIEIDPKTFNAAIAKIGQRLPLLLGGVS